MSGPHPRLLPDSVYVDGVAIPATFFQGLDTAQASGIDGDTGGTWNPSSAIQIAGSGMYCAGEWDFTSGAFVFSEDIGADCTFGDGDDFQLETGHAGQTRLIAEALDGALDASHGSTSNGQPRLIFSTSNSAVLMNNSDPTTYVGGARCVLPLRVHDGATLSNVNIYFRVGTTHASPPTSFPQFRVFMVDRSGNVTNLGANLVGDVGNGFFEFQGPGTGAAWYALGNTQSFVLDTNAVQIDLSNFTYYLEIIDEAGTTPGTDVYTGNYYIAYQARYVTIPDLRFQ